MNYYTKFDTVDARGNPIDIRHAAVRKRKFVKLTNPKQDTLARYEPMRLMFQSMENQGLTLKQMVRELAQAGIKTASGRDTWAMSQVHAVLHMLGIR